MDKVLLLSFICVLFLSLCIRESSAQCGAGLQNVEGSCLDINECTEIVAICGIHTCSNTDGSYECICNSGYEVADDNQTCVDIDECSLNSSPCGGHTCINTAGSYQCSCRLGCTNDPNDLQICIDINECADNYCNQNCVNLDCLSGRYQCSCNSGYQLASDNHTCIDIDECSLDSSLCGGHTCINTVGSYQCSCRLGCMNDPNDVQMCIDTDECAAANTNDCSQGCTNLDCLSGRYRCSCNSGFGLGADNHTCIDTNECNTGNNCSQLCSNNIGSYTCDCNEGCTLNSDGLSCDDINECDTNNGGCSQVCTNSFCTDGRFSCSCESGYVLHSDGFTCIDIDECAADNECEQICINNNGSFTCSCMEGCTLDANGNTCSDFNECQSPNPRLYCDQICTNKDCADGGYQCSCNTGYILNLNNNKTCLDIDECDVDNGGCSQLCLNDPPGSYSCSCRPGYSLEADGVTCTALPCSPRLEAPLNGNYNCSDPAVGVTGDICSFTCNDGYDINGSVTRRCQDNSTWTGVTTTCTRKSCQPLQATETYLIARECNTEFGSSCTIFCPYGYYNGTPGADYYQEYCVLDDTGNQLEWGNTDTQCTPLSSPCNPNPCMNNGACSVQDSLPVCSCTQYFTGQYCETRLLQFLSSLPSLAVGDQSDRLYILTEIGHTDDITVHVFADSTINVSPSPMVSIDPGTGSGNFALRGSSAGAYSIRYSVYSQGSSVALSTYEQYFIVYDYSNSLSSTGLYETQGVLKSPGCCSLNLSDSFCQYWTQSISSSCSVGMDANNTIKTNGISFMHSGGLSLPLSLIGVSISPSSLSMAPNTDEVYCTNCTNSSGTCVSSDAKNSDSAILARDGALLRTFLSQAPSLLPSGITLMPTDAVISRNLAMYDFMSDLISDSDHISDQCQGLQVNSPTYVLRSNSRISASVNGETMNYNANDIICFSLALCSLPFSPLTVSLPATGSNTLISSLSGFRYYSNWDWSLSIGSVYLSSNGAINNNDLFFNSLRLWSGSDWITNYSSSFNDVGLFVTAGHTSRGDTYDLIVTSNFTGHVSFSLQRQNPPVLFNGEGVLSITALINSDPQSFALSSQTAQGILINESNPDFSRGFSVNMNYDSVLSSDFYHDLFPLRDASTACPVSSFVNLRTDFTPGWVSLYTQCLGLKIHGMTIYGLTTELTFHSSSSFSLYTHNISLTIKAYNNGVKPIKLGKVLSLPNYASTGSYILLNYSTSGDVNGMIRNARLSLYDVDVETIIVVTPTGLTIGLSSGSPQGIYNMNIRGVIHPGDSWDTAGVVIESQLTGSSLSGSFFNQLRSNVHSVLAESGDYANLRLGTVQSNLDSSQETNSSFASSLMTLWNEYNTSTIEYQEAVQSYVNAVEASNQKGIVFNATIGLYLSETQIDAVYNAAQCINNCGTDCTMPYSFRPCTSDISLPVNGLADFNIPRNQTYRNPSTSQVNSCSSVSDCDDVIGVRWIERQGLVLPVAYNGLDCTNTCQSSLLQVNTYADSNLTNTRTRSEPIVSSHYNTSRYYTCSLSTCTLQPVSQPCASIYVECDHSRRIQLINEASSVATQASIANLFRISSEYDALLANVSLTRAELNNKELEMVLLGERLNLTSAALTSASEVATKSMAPVSSVSELLEREIGIRDWIQAHNSASDVLDVSSLNFTAELTSPSSNRISLHIGYYFPNAPSSSYPLSSNIDLNIPPQFIIDQLTNELITDARDNNNNNNNNNNNGRKRRQQADIDTRGIFLNKCNTLQQFMSYVSFINASLTEAISETTATMMDIASLSSRLQYRYNTIVSNSTSLSMSEQANLQSRESLYLAQAQYQLQQQSLTVSQASIVHWLKPIELYHSSHSSISSLSCYTFTDCLSAISGYIFSELVRIPSASASLYSHKANVNNAIELIAQRSNRAITLSDVQSAMENISTVLRYISDANYWCVSDPFVSSQLPPVLPILEQSSAILHCNVNSSLPIRYQWNKDDIIISNEPSSDLTLISFNADDSGLYSCKGITDFETVETLPTQAYLYRPPVLGQTPQRVSTHLYSSKGLRFECTAHSHPLSPSWYWEYAANEGGSWNRIINETSNVLMIRNPSMSDNGYYRCTASTEHGSATSPSIRGTVFRPSVSVPKYNFTITLSSLGSGSGADNTGSEAGLDIVRSYLVRVLASMNIVASWMGVTAEGDSYYRASFLIAAATVNDTIPHIDQLVSWYENQLESLTTQKSLIMNYFSSSLNNNDEDVEIISNSLITSQRKYVCPSGAGLDTDNYIFCVPCDSGYYSETGFLTDIYRYIKPGTYIKDYISLCTTCPVGYYQPNTGSTGCTSCDPLYSTEGTGSISSDECKALCQPHYYSVDGLSPCTPCPTGYYQPLYGSTSCLLCNNNTDSLQYCPETTPGGTTTPTDDAEFDVIFVASVAGGSTLALLILCVMIILVIALISRRRSANKKKKSEKDKVVFQFIPRRAGVGGGHNKSGGRSSSKKYSDNPLYMAPDSQEMKVMSGSTSEHSIMKTEMTGLSNIDELSDLERSIDDEPIDSDTVPLYAVPSDEKIEEEVKEGEGTSQKEESEKKENVDEEKAVKEEVVEEEGDEEKVDDEAPLIEKKEKAVAFSDDATVINQIEETEVPPPLTETNEGDTGAVVETVPPPVDMETVPPPVDMETVPPPVDMETVPPPVDVEAIPPPVDVETVPPLVVLETVPPPLPVTDEATTYVLDVETSPSGEIEPSDDVKRSTSDDIPLEGEEVPTITLVDENNEVIGPPEGGLDDISEDEFIKQMMSTDDTQPPTVDQTDPTDADQTDADQTDAGQTDADQTDADQTDADQTDADQTDADPTTITDAPENTSEVPKVPEGEKTTKEATIPTEDDQPKGESADSKDEEATITTVEGDELQIAIDQALLEAKLAEEAYKEKGKKKSVPAPVPATTDEETPTEAIKDEESSTPPPPPPPLSPVPAEQEESAVQEEAPKKKHAIIIVQSDSKDEDEDEDEDDEGKETLIDDMPSSYSYNIADSEKKLQDIRRKSSPFVGGRADLLRVGEDHLKPASSLPALNVDEDYGDVAKSSASTSKIYN